MPQPKVTAVCSDVASATWPQRSWRGGPGRAAGGGLGGKAAGAAGAKFDGTPSKGRRSALRTVPMRIFEAPPGSDAGLG